MHCQFCGNDLGEVKQFPVSCRNCENITYKNPIPVVVGIVVAMHGGNTGVLLVHRRGGNWALPGGFIDLNDDSYQSAMSRELREETGFVVPPWWTVYAVETATNKNILLFLRGQGSIDFDNHNFVPNDEVDEIRVAFGPEELAFPSHTLILERALRDLAEKPPTDDGE